jgi:hypothetical protein
MNNISDDLWARIRAAFVGHAGNDPSSQAALERIAQKCRYASERAPLDETNCTVRTEQLMLADLDNLTLYHPRTTPRRDMGALVILVVDGRRIVIDGNSRTNLWKSERRTGPFEALVIVPNKSAA